MAFLINQNQFNPSTSTAASTTNTNIGLTDSQINDLLDKILQELKATYITNDKTIEQVLPGWFAYLKDSTKQESIALRSAIRSITDVHPFFQNFETEFITNFCTNFIRLKITYNDLIANAAAYLKAIDPQATTDVVFNFFNSINSIGTVISNCISNLSTNSRTKSEVAKDILVQKLPTFFPSLNILRSGSPIKTWLDSINWDTNPVFKPFLDDAYNTAFTSIRPYDSSLPFYNESDFETSFSNVLDDEFTKFNSEYDDPNSKSLIKQVALAYKGAIASELSKYSGFNSNYNFDDIINFANYNGDKNRQINILNSLIFKGTNPEIINLLKTFTSNDDDWRFELKIIPATATTQIKLEVKIFFLFENTQKETPVMDFIGNITLPPSYQALQDINDLFKKIPHYDQSSGFQKPIYESEMLRIFSRSLTSMADIEKIRQQEVSITDQELTEYLSFLYGKAITLPTSFTSIGHQISLKIENNKLSLSISIDNGTKPKISETIDSMPIGNILFSPPIIDVELQSAINIIKSIIDDLKNDNNFKIEWSPIWREQLFDVFGQLLPDSRNNAKVLEMLSPKANLDKFINELNARIIKRLGATIANSYNFAFDIKQLQSDSKDISIEIKATTANSLVECPYGNVNLYTWTSAGSEKTTLDEIENLLSTISAKESGLFGSMNIDNFHDDIKQVDLNANLDILQTNNYKTYDEFVAYIKRHFGITILPFEFEIKTIDEKGITFSIANNLNRIDRSPLNKENKKFVSLAQATQNEKDFTMNGINDHQINHGPDKLIDKIVSTFPDLPIYGINKIIDDLLAKHKDLPQDKLDALEKFKRDFDALASQPISRARLFMEYAKIMQSLKDQSKLLDGISEKQALDEIKDLIGKDNFNKYEQKIRANIDTLHSVFDDLKSSGMSKGEMKTVLLKIISNNKLLETLANNFQALETIISSTLKVYHHYPKAYFAGGAILGGGGLLSAAATGSSISSMIRMKKYGKKSSASRTIAIISAIITVITIGASVAMMLWFFLQKGGFN